MRNAQGAAVAARAGRAGATWAHPDEESAADHVEWRESLPGQVDAVADNSVEIPNRAAFKAAEVCEIAQIPPYVLRSWEKEFPRLGAVARPGGLRIYTRHDIEQILRIKQLVFTEGLTLAGARRKLEGDASDTDELQLPDVLPALSEAARTRVADAKRELRSLLDLLSHPASTWPRVPVKRAADAQGQREIANETLPLLDGVPDTPPKPRRARRPAREGTGEPSTKVE
jgi:DNA-binding transcriptional MerR regulator